MIGHRIRPRSATLSLQMITETACASVPNAHFTPLFFLSLTGNTPKFVALNLSCVNELLSIIGLSFNNNPV